MLRGLHQCTDTPTQLKYLLAKAKSRISVMKIITGSDIRAGYHVLCSFYVHAIHSIVDYSSIALLQLTPSQISKLETIQNKCMRLILGAPWWTRLANLREESHLVPLQTCNQQMVAGSIGKIVSRRDDGPLAKSLRHNEPKSQNA